MCLSWKPLLTTVFPFSTKSLETRYYRKHQGIMDDKGRGRDGGMNGESGGGGEGCRGKEGEGEMEEGRGRDG